MIRDSKIVDLEKSKVEGKDIGNFRPIATPGRMDYSPKAALKQITENPFNHENVIQRILRERGGNKPLFTHKIQKTE